MTWYAYMASFLAGMFLANAVPHFVHGISGDRFPTPFAKPSGKGLSSPTVNVAWSLVNLAAGCVLFHVGKVWDGAAPQVLCFAGAAILSLPSSVHFTHKHRD